MSTVALALLSLAVLFLTELLFLFLLVWLCLRADARAQQPPALTLPEQRRRTLQMAAHPASGRDWKTWREITAMEHRASVTRH